MTKKTDATAALRAALDAYIREKYDAPATDLVDAWRNQRPYWCKESGGPRWSDPRLPDGSVAPACSREFADIYDSLNKGR